VGQKVHPKVFRLGIIRDWDAKWFADKKSYARLLHEDITIRDHIKRKMYAAGISRVEIERAANRLKITIHTGRPGMVIGRGGAGVEELRHDIEKLTDRQVAINIVEVRIPETDAQLVAENIAAQLEKRISFRRAMKQAVQRAMKIGARGVKVICGGRLGGAEIARRERYVDGTVPLHTLRADIDYGVAEAHTTYGRIGIKVWVCHGEVRGSEVAARREEDREGIRREGSGRRAGRGEGGPRGGGRSGGRSGGRGGGRQAARPAPAVTGAGARAVTGTGAGGPAAAPAAAEAPAAGEPAAGEPAAEGGGARAAAKEG